MGKRWFLVGVMLLLASLLVVGCGIANETAERSVSLPATDATSVRIIAEAGSLKVNGRSGIAETGIPTKAKLIELDLAWLV